MFTENNYNVFKNARTREGLTGLNTAIGLDDLHTYSVCVCVTERQIQSKYTEKLMLTPLQQLTP